MVYASLPILLNLEQYFRRTTSWYLHYFTAAPHVKIIDGISILYSFSSLQNSDREEHLSPLFIPS